MKMCFKCKVEKELSEFYHHPQMGDGFLNKCKICTRLDVKDRSIKKQVELREYDKVRYRTNFNRIKWHKYRGIVNRCTGGHKNRTYFVQGMQFLSRDEYDEWWDKNITQFMPCYNTWKLSEYKNRLAPSIDRIDSKKGYTPDNMQWLTLTVNCSKKKK